MLRRRSSERLRDLQTKAAARRVAIQKQSEEAKKNREAAAQPRAKVSRQDVLALKEIFDGLDLNKDGHITLAELQRQLSKRRAEAMRYDGLERSAQQRKDLRALEQSGMHRFADALITFCDVGGNRDGTIDFDELLRALYPKCSEREYAAMHSYVAPPEEPTPPTAVERLSSSEREEICAVFRLYDTDGSGWLSSAEWAAAAVRCGLSPAEEQRWFDVLSTRDDELGDGEGVGDGGGDGESAAVIGVDAFVAFMADSVLHWRARPEYVGVDGLRYVRLTSHWTTPPPKPRSPRARPRASLRNRTAGALPHLASSRGALEASAAPATSSRPAHPLERALDAALKRRAARRACTAATAAAYSVRTPAHAVLVAHEVEARRKANAERRLKGLIADVIAF